MERIKIAPKGVNQLPFHLLPGEVIDEDSHCLGVVRESRGWDGVCSFFFSLCWPPAQTSPRSVHASFHATRPAVTSKPGCGCF